MSIDKIAILGAGLMGSGIAQVGAMGGYQVILFDVSEQALKHAQEAIEKRLKKGVDLGKVNQEAMIEALKNLNYTADLNGIAGADLVIEAVPEDIQIKWDMYQKVNEICGDDIIIGSNTSALSITELASAVKRPDKFIGMHFFNPVHIMRLVEVVKGLETSEETCKLALEVSHRMGKETVEINEFPGFVTSRMNAVIGLEAFKMLEQGVGSAEDIDKAIKLGLNHPMGPFEMIDLVGLDTRLKTLEYLTKTLGDRYKPSPKHVQYVKAGRLGKKVSKGVYDYNKK